MVAIGNVRNVGLETTGDQYVTADHNLETMLSLFISIQY